MPTMAPISAAISPPAGSVTQNGRCEVHGEVGGRVGADRHEGGMPDGDLAGVADQDVEAERADDGDQGRD